MTSASLKTLCHIATDDARPLSVTRMMSTTGVCCCLGSIMSAFLYLFEAFCYGLRDGSSEEGCKAKKSPFWDTFRVDFDSSMFYQPIGYDTFNPAVANQWNSRLLICVTLIFC